MADYVMARAFRGEPVRMAAMSASNGLIYLINPARLDAVRNGESFPTGFPREDVFAYDEQLFRRLRGRWDETGTTDPELWDAATPYASDRR